MIEVAQATDVDFTLYQTWRLVRWKSVSLSQFDNIFWVIVCLNIHVSVKTESIVLEPVFSAN